MTCGKPCQCPTYRDHLLSVNLSASATPTRTGHAQVVDTNRRETKLDKDLSAYKRLRHDGLQPVHTGGAAEVEQRATCEQQIESGLMHVKERSWQAFTDEFGHSAFEPQTTPREGD
jgi:hypothetical protein